MFRTVIGLLVAASLAQAQPVISAAVNAASNHPWLAPGTWMTIYGSSLAPETRSAPSVPLPTSLSGVGVTVNDIAAPLLFVSPGQINAIVPFEVTVTSGKFDSAKIVVTTAAGSSAPHFVSLTTVAPALFTVDMSGAGRAIVLSPEFELKDSVESGEIVIVYAAGLGQTDPPASSASGGASAEPLNRVPASAMPDIYVGNQKATVLFAGLAPGFPGVYQLNLQLASSAASDRVVLSSGGIQGNVTQIGVHGGQNVANVSGTLTGLFPSDGSDPGNPPSGYPYTFSLMPQVTSFSVAMDILPGASPFTILATGETGSASISVNPAAGTWQATNTTLSEAARQGDYSGAGYTVRDYLACRIVSGLICELLPGNIVPASRLDPTSLHALYDLPSPNGAGSMYTATGEIPAGRRLVFDAQTNSTAAIFAGLMQIPLGYSTSRTAPLRLYVDGKLVASKDVAYSVIARP